MLQRLARLVALPALLAVIATGIAIYPAEAGDGGLDLSAYKGKVVYLDFWASWCNPCRQSFPWMNDLQETYRGNGLVVIGINVDHDRDMADEFLRRTPADFKIVYDPDGEIARQFEFKDMPTSVIIDRDGKIRFVHAGFFLDKRGEYVAHVRALLSKRAS